MITCDICFASVNTWPDYDRHITWHEEHSNILQEHTSLIERVVGILEKWKRR